MARSLYTLLSYLALPLIFVRLWWRGRVTPAYRERWRERLALYPARLSSRAAMPAAAVLFHAVSVGEVHAAQPLIETLLKLRPDLTIVVTCTTPTGSARVQQLFAARVDHRYFPYDLPGAMRRFLRYFDPSMIVLLETELWPNLLHQCAQRGTPVILANARLSERSFQRYRRYAAVTAAMLHSLDTVVAQAAADGERFVALGLPASRLRINGSLKFDVAIAADKVQAGRRLKAQWERPVWIAASTREGEDAQLLQAMQLALRQQADLLLVLVPRHPERFAEAAAQASAAGLRVQRFSVGGDIESACQVLVGDTMGDMYFYYALADIAFVGGSLVDTGCQNLIEPAALGLPVLSGPSLYNFQAVSDLLRDAGAQIVVADAGELAEQLIRLCANPAEAQAMGLQARAVVAANQGATARLGELILERLG